jgi:hypothetical protein
MIFQEAIIGNSRAGKEQWQEVVRARDGYMFNEEAHADVLRRSGMVGNEGLIPQDVYQEFDNVTVQRFRSDDGDTILNDLLPLSRSVSIGKLTHKFRRASDAGKVQTSMTGQIGVKMDQTEFDYDGSIVPIHDTGFGRNWREWNAQSSEGFDALIDDQRECVASIRRHVIDQFLDGHRDAKGQLITIDGISWAGMRNDNRVAQANIGASGINFDFTDTTKTYAEIEAAFKLVRDILWITNKCEKEATYYISREMASNFERNSSESYSSEKITNRLAQLNGVASIKISSKLSGNEFMAVPLSDNLVRPIVGMAVNTVAMPRPVYNSNYEFAVWGAIGFEVRSDYFGNKCALFAQDLG